MSNPHSTPMIGNLLIKFLDTDFDTTSWKVSDWAFAAITLGVGVYYFWPLWIAVGAVSAFGAWWRPLTRLQNFARGILRRARKKRA
jgi:hypothetical protein